MEKSAKFLAMLMMMLFTSVSFTSCSDDDGPDPNAYYDFSIVWDVVNQGDYSIAEAQALVAVLTDSGEYAFEGYKTNDAIEAFEDFCQAMRYTLGTGYTKITLKAKLMRIEGSKVIASKTFFIDPEGTTIKLPAYDTPTDTVVVE